MQHRVPPTLKKYLNPRYLTESKIQRAITSFINAKNDDARTRILKPFAHEERQYIGYMAAIHDRYGDFDQKLFLRELSATRQVVAMPRITDIELDTWAALAQPEVIRALADTYLEPGRRGVEPNPLYTLGIMSQLVMQPGSQVKGIERGFQKQPAMHRMLAKLETLVAAERGEAPRPFELRDYSTVLDQLEKLSIDASYSDSNSYRYMRTNVEIVRAIAEIYPDAGIGETLFIDGTDIPAWCPQANERKRLKPDEDSLSDAADEYLENETVDEESDDADRVSRKPGPTPTLRVIGHTRKEKLDLTNEQQAPISGGKMIVKMWNGWMLVALVELKTGLPLVWTLQTATDDEAPAIRELLKLLFELWPSCPAKTIVADKAWDERDWYVLTELNYGIHLVAGRVKDRAEAQHIHEAGRSKWFRDKKKRFWIASENSEQITGHDGRGRCFCRKHGVRLTNVGGTWGSRQGLAPGEENKPVDFRVRFDCDAGCPRMSLPVGIDWDAFSYWPHHGADMPDRYAHRIALEHRRNICECIFSSLKTVANLGNQGAARTRLHDYDRVHTLISYAFMLRSSLLIASLRIQRGEFTAAIPKLPYVLQARSKKPAAPAQKELAA